MTLGKGENMKTRISRKIGVFILIFSFIISMMLPISVNTVNAEDNTEKFELLGKIFRGTCGCCRDTCTLEFYSYQYNSTQDTCLKVNDGGEITYIYFNYGLWNSNTNTLGIYAGAVTGAWSWYAPLSIRGEWKDGKFNFLISLPNGSNICAGDFDLIYSPPEPEEPEPEEPWVPDGAFSISKSGAWVSGKECALYGSYSASTPGNADAEAEEIVWSSSDPSILDVSDAIIDFNVADAENNHVSIQKSFTAKKAGTVTVTATTLDGRSSSVTVDIEPELIAVETEKNLRMETEVTLCRMTLDKPDRAFLESVMSKVEIQVSSNPYNTFEIIDKYYDISEDGLSGKFVYVLKPKTDGFASFHITTFEGQEVEITVKSEPYFEWTNQDQWSFLNSPTTDAFGTDTTEGYYISQEDYDRLISSLPNNEKDLITYTEKFADANIQGVNIYNYNIDGLSANAHREWTGSCYGMSVWACLVKAGVINANDIADNIEYINQYLCDPEVESAINYYHFQFELSKVQTEVSDFMTSPEKHIQVLKNLPTDFKENGSPAVIWYQWYETFLADGTGDKAAAHAVAAYDVKEIDPVTINVQDTSYEYNYRVYVYDCTYPEDTHSQEDIIGSTDIFFNDDGVWCIPRHQIVCDTSKWKGDSDFGSGINYNRKNNGYMDYITADTDILNSVDYNTGVYNQGKVMNDFVSIIANTDQKYSISAKDFSASIKGFTVSDVAGEVPIFVSIAPNVTTTGEYMPTTGTAFLPQSDFYRIESDDSYMSFSMKSDHYLTNIQSGTSGIINLYSDGSIYALMDESDSCSVRLTANDGYHTLSWYTVQVSGLDMKEISAEWTDDGVLLNGDNLENITVIGTNDDDEQEMTFSTDEDSVLISESDNNLIILVDTDNDGVYETDVNEKEEHIHEYGTPEFVWSEDYQTCTAIFTCETCDNEQKMECDITSETTDPTCTEDGKTVYTATVFFVDQEYADTQEEVITATGHTYEYKDNGDGTHTKVCTAGDDTAADPHTYQDGICTLCGAEEPGDHVHEYGEPEFIWSDDSKSCTIVFTCMDGDDQHRIECEVTSEITDETCTENGKAIYTAKGSFNGEEYTDKKEVEIPASGHTYGTPAFNWSEDHQTCTAVFTCASCDNEQKMECDITTSETTDPTCTKDGKVVYTATVSFADKEYADTQEEVISATGHAYEYTDNRDGTHTKVCTSGDDTATEPHTYQDGTCTFCGAEEPEGHIHKYGEPKFTWSDDYSSCTATFICADGDDQQIMECTVTSKDNGDGTVSYTAVAEFNGKSYTAEQVVDIQDEPDEKPESGKPIESGDDKNSGDSADTNLANANKGVSENKTDKESVSDVKTGDDSNLVLWSLLIASMISAGAIVLLIRKKKNIQNSNM